MSDHLDRDIGERMLAGEDTGPRPLAALLAAASARPVRDDRRGEETAVAAFRAARSGSRVAVPASRRLLLPRVIVVKAALVGLVLVFVGGVAVAASPHLRPSSRHRHTHAPRTPTSSVNSTERLVVPRPSPTAPSRSPTKSEGSEHGHSKGKTKNENEGRNRNRGRGNGKGDGLLPTPLPTPPLPVEGPGDLSSESQAPADPLSSSPGCDASCAPDG